MISKMKTRILMAFAFAAPACLLFALSAATGAIAAQPRYTKAILETPLPLCTVLENSLDRKAPKGCGVVRHDRWVLNPTHASVGRFHNGLAAVKTWKSSPGKGLYGYVDGDGRWVIPPTYKMAGSFRHGVAAVTLPGGKRGVIDKAGKWALPFTYAGLSILNANLFAVSTTPKGKWGLVNRKGEWVTKEQMKYAPYPVGKTGYFSFSDGQKFGLLNASGRIVLKPAYKNILGGAGGLFVAGNSKDLLGMVNLSGKWVIPPRYYNLEPFSSGLVAARLPKAKAGYIDKSGAWAIAPRFERSYAFSEGLARVLVKKGGKEKWGFVDRKGNYVLPPRYYSADEFKNGYAQVLRELGESYGLIDYKGRFFAQPEFRYFNQISPHYTLAEYGGIGTDKKKGNRVKGMRARLYIDSNGQLYPSFMRKHFNAHKTYCHSFTRRPWDFPKHVDGFRIGAMCLNLIESWATNGDAQSLVTAAMLGGGDKPMRRRQLVRAANLGHKRAQYMLGKGYIFGSSRYGLSKNLSRGNSWLKKAASAGEPNAQLLLGINYGDGHGIGRDFSRSISLIRQAMRNGRGNRDFTYMKLARDSLARVKRIRSSVSHSSRSARSSGRGGTSLLDVYNRNISPYIDRNQVRRDIARNKAEAQARRQCDRAKSSCRKTCYGLSDRGRSAWDAASPRKKCLSRCRTICG